MDIKQFTELIVEILFQQHGLRTKMITTVKMNDEVLTGICNDSTKKIEVSPVVYTNTIYDAYLRQELSLNKAAENVFELLQQPVPNLINSIQNYDYAAPKLRMAAASANNSNYLSDTVNIMRFGIYFYPVVALGDGMICKVTKELMHVWDITYDKLLRDVYDIMKERLRVTTLLFPGEVKMKLHVVSDMEQLYGASALLYPARLSDLATSVGYTRAYVLPSSRYELLLVNTDNYSGDDLRSIVCCVNAETVGKEDFLSDNVFLLDTNTRKIVMCD